MGEFQDVKSQTSLCCHEKGQKNRNFLKENDNDLNQRLHKLRILHRAEKRRNLYLKHIINYQKSVIKKGRSITKKQPTPFQIKRKAEESKEGDILKMNMKIIWHKLRINEPTPFQ